MKKQVKYINWLKSHLNDAEYFVKKLSFIEIMSKITPDEQDFSLELKKRFSLCLKRVMFEFELSNKDLALKTGLDSTYISHLRSGKRLPNFENFIKILEALSNEGQEYFINLLFNKKGVLKVAEKSNTYKV